MTISSRTPEGDPNVCPICGHDVRLEPSIDTRDGPCPSCGHLLWFREPAGRQPRRRKTFESLLMRTGRERLGPFPIELEMRLIHVVGPLIKQHALPGTAEIESLVSTNATWAELIAVLELKAGIGKAGAWQHMMRSAGKAVARVKRLFAKAES